MYLCKFRKEWLTKDDYKKWVQESSDNKKAYCKVCKKTIDLTSHMKSKKHIDSLAVHSGTSAQQSIIAAFYSSSISKTIDLTTTTASEPEKVSSEDTNERRSLTSAHFISDYVDS